MTNDPRQEWEDGEMPDYEAGGLGIAIGAWGVLAIIGAICLAAAILVP